MLAEIQSLHNRNVLLHLGWPKDGYDDLFGDRGISTFYTWLKDWRAPGAGRGPAVWCSSLRGILNQDEGAYMFSLRQILSNGGKDKSPEPESITSDHYARGSLICFKQVWAILEANTHPDRRKQLFGLACNLLVRAVSLWQAEDARGPGGVFNEGLYGIIKGAKEGLCKFAKAILSTSIDQLKPLWNREGCHVLIGRCMRHSVNVEHLRKSGDVAGLSELYSIQEEWATSDELRQLVSDIFERTGSITGTSAWTFMTGARRLTFCTRASHPLATSLEG